MARSYGVTFIREADARQAREACQEIATQLGRRLYLAEASGPWTPVYVDQFGQDPSAARQLSANLSAQVIHLLLHDEDYAAYLYFSGVDLVEEWAHPRDYFGDLEESASTPARGAIGGLFDVDAGSEAFRSWADSATHRSAEELLEDLARRLGVSELLGAFEEIEEGLPPRRLESSSPVLIEPEGAVERRKRERREVRAAVRDLKKEGLLVEEVSRRGKRPPLHPMPLLTPAGSGFLLAWQELGPPVTEKVSRLYGDGEARFDAVELSGSAHRIAVGGPDDNLLAVGHSRGNWSLEVYDLQSGERLLDLPQPRLVEWLEFSADGSLLLALSDHRLIIVRLDRALPDRDSVSSLELPSRGVAAAMHPDGEWLVVAHQDVFMVIDLGRMKVSDPIDLWSRDYDSWHEAVVKGEAETGFYLKEQARALRSDRSGDRLAIATDLGIRIVEWPAVTQHRLEIVARAPSELVRVGDSVLRHTYACLFAPDDGSVLYAGLEGKMQQLDIESGNAAVLLDLPDRAPILELHASADHRFLATLCRPKMFDRKPSPPILRIWDYKRLLHRRPPDSPEVPADS